MRQPLLFVDVYQFVRYLAPEYYCNIDQHSDKVEMGRREVEIDLVSIW